MRRQYKTAKDKCPKCGNKIYWKCIGKSGYAYCSKSIYASRYLDDKSFCDWKGTVVREDDGSVYFIIERD
jgi:hypothetical protein